MQMLSVYGIDQDSITIFYEKTISIFLKLLLSILRPNTLTLDITLLENWSKVM